MARIIVVTLIFYIGVFPLFPAQCADASKKCGDLGDRCGGTSDPPCCGALDGKDVQCRRFIKEGLWYPYCLPYKHIPPPWDKPKGRAIQWEKECYANDSCPQGRSVHFGNLREPEAIRQIAHKLRADPMEVEATVLAIKALRRSKLMHWVVDEEDEE